MFNDYRTLLTSGSSFCGLEIPPAPSAQKAILTPAVESDPLKRLMELSKSCPESRDAFSLARQMHSLYVSGDPRKLAALGALTAWTWAVIRRADELSVVGGAASYFALVEQLRFIMQIASRPETIQCAREALADLYLAQTTAEPWEWYKDSYTGEVDPEAEGELEANRAAQALLKGDDETFELAAENVQIAQEKISAQYAGQQAPVIPTSENSLVVRLTEVYDPQTARLAIRAAMGNLGDLVDEVVFDDDREWTPATLEKDFNPDLTCVDWGAANRYRQYKRACWAKAYKYYPTRSGMTFAMRRWTKEQRDLEFRDQFLGDKANIADVQVRKELIGYLNHLGADNLQAAAVYAYPFIVDELDTTVVDLLLDEIDDTIVDCLELFETEIAERADAMHRSSEWEVERVDEYDREFIAALARTMPAQDANPTKTSSWQVAYMTAIAAGSSQKAAMSTAWAAWRIAMSPAGAQAYDKALAEGATQNKATAAFWSKCGNDVPRKQATIKALNANGMKILEVSGQEREITWFVADKKLLNHELDLTKKDKLIEILKANRWGYAKYFLQHLLVK